MSIVWPQDETSTYPRPLSGSQAATSRKPSNTPQGAFGRPQRLTVQEKICGGHGPGETPEGRGPFRTRKLRRSARRWYCTRQGVGENRTRRTTRTGSPIRSTRPKGRFAPARRAETLTTQTHTPPQKHPGLLALMRPTSGTIPGQPRRRGRRETARRVPISAGNRKTARP